MKKIKLKLELELDDYITILCALTEYSSEQFPYKKLMKKIRKPYDDWAWENPKEYDAYISRRRNPQTQK